MLAEAALKERHGSDNVSVIVVGLSPPAHDGVVSPLLSQHPDLMRIADISDPAAAHTTHATMSAAASTSAWPLHRLPLADDSLAPPSGFAPNDMPPPSHAPGLAAGLANRWASAGASEAPKAHVPLSWQLSQESVSTADPCSPGRLALTAKLRMSFNEAYPPSAAEEAALLSAEDSCEL